MINDISGEYLSRLALSDSYSDVLAEELSPETLTQEQKELLTVIAELRLDEAYRSGDRTSPRYREIYEMIQRLYAAIRTGAPLVALAPVAPPVAPAPVRTRRVKLIRGDDGRISELEIEG